MTLRPSPPILLFLAGALSCTGRAPSAESPLSATGLRLPPPSRSIQLRAAFDKDPTVYIGRFVPDALGASDVDENAAVVTRCSKFIKPKTVDAQEEMDESMYISRSASLALGLPMVASAAASAESRARVRVKYSLTKKIQSDIDADGLAQCCKADPSQCTKTIIGEFLAGSGDVLQSARDSDKASADVHTPRPVTASGDYRSEDAWKKTVSFKDVYFAFLTQASPVAAAPVANDCSFCDALPGSLDGKYFCGVSSDMPDEASARSLALRAAREQVVAYLGQSIKVSGTTTAVAAALTDQTVVAVASDGVASEVKDERWCKERIPTPDGEKVRSKVLVFYPKAAEDAGRKAVTDAASHAKKR